MAKDRESDYAALLACFRTEQMSMAQLQAHMAEDPEFARRVRQEIGAVGADEIHAPA